MLLRERKIDYRYHENIKSNQEKNKQLIPKYWKNEQFVKIKIILGAPITFASIEYVNNMQFFKRLGKKIQYIVC